MQHPPSPFILDGNYVMIPLIIYPHPVYIVQFLKQNMKLDFVLH